MNETQEMVADVLREARTCDYCIETIIRGMADAFVGVNPGFDRDALSGMRRVTIRTTIDPAEP